MITDDVCITARRLNERITQFANDEIYDPVKDF